MTSGSPKVFIAMPAYGQTNYAQTTSSLVNTVLMLKHNGMYGRFGWQSYPDIADLRNQFLTLWYDRFTECTHLLMVDSDMGWPFELVADMITADWPVVGCIYPKKTLPTEFVGSLSLDQRGAPPGFRRATGLGGGVLLIRRDAIAKMLDHDPGIADYGIHRYTAGIMLQQYKLTRLIEAFAKIKNDKEYVSEDISFCRRATAAGVGLLANVRHRVTHVGAHEYTAAFEDSLMRVEFAAE